MIVYVIPAICLIGSLHKLLRLMPPLQALFRLRQDNESEGGNLGRGSPLSILFLQELPALIHLLKTAMAGL